MNKKVLFPAIMAGSLTLACSAPVIADDDCEPPQNMKLWIGEYHLELDEKKFICAPVPSEFIITVKGKSNYTVSPGQVTVAKKADSGGPQVTVEGNNDDDEEELVIRLTGVATKDTIVSFLIDVEDVGVLDPKIKIIDNNIWLHNTSKAMSEAAKGMGTYISPEELIPLVLDAQDREDP